MSTTLAIELRDRGARCFGRLHLARQQIREPRQEREHLGWMAAFRGD
jgi:hypothetical protein